MKIVKEPLPVAAFRDGDACAFKEIYQLYYRPLCYFAFTLTADMPQAEDIASESLEKLWVRRGNFESEPGIKSFLYTTTRNASLNFLKSLKVRSSAHDELLYLTRAQEDYVLGQIIRSQLLKHIYDEIEKLPPKAKAVFKMVYLEDLTIYEIAEKLDMPEQTVRNNKSRALELLRCALLKKDVLAALLLQTLFYISH